MCDINKSNFENFIPLVESALKRSEFVAIDTEFTGLQVDESSKPSLFDTSNERYLKLKKSVTQFTICQIGISAFVNTESNHYEAHTFNCYLFPSAFGSIDVRFKCQASSFSFLCQYDFDFNKFVYEGVSYLNSEQELSFREHISRNVLFSGLDREVDEHVVQSVCSQIAEWFVRSKTEEVLLLDSESGIKQINDYLLHTEIRTRFPQLWTHTDQFGNILVEHVSRTRRKELEEQDVSQRQNEEEQLFQTMLGFTRIFRLIQKYRKPVVGHNMLTDLIFLFEKFHKPLPATFDDFKKEIHGILPHIYDTKHIISSVKKNLSKVIPVDSTGLQKLYEMFTSTEGKQYVLFSPIINHAAGFDKYKSVQLPHEAGCDAFMCGVVFLRLAHILSRKDLRSTEIKACGFNSYIPHLENYLNCVNIIRATINHVNLNGRDPKSERPEILYVRSREARYKLKTHQLAQWFSQYGTVDVKLQRGNTALIATGNYLCAKDILRNFKKNEKIIITKYNFWRHSLVARGLLWFGAVSSTAVCIGILFASFKSI